MAKGFETLTLGTRALPVLDSFELQTQVVKAPSGTRNITVLTCAVLVGEPKKGLLRLALTEDGLRRLAERLSLAATGEIPPGTSAH